jgi:hypothetical protein
MAGDYERVRRAIESLLNPRNPRIQQVVEALRSRKEGGYKYGELASVVTCLAPFVSGRSYGPGNTFLDLSRDFSGLPDDQKNDLQALYQKELEVLEKEIGV